jgi:putative ABC transport system permease protein
VGLALGVATAEVIVRALGAAELVTPNVTIAALLLAMLVAMVTGAVGSLYPAWRVTRLRPAELLG